MSLIRSIFKRRGSDDEPKDDSPQKPIIPTPPIAEAPKPEKKDEDIFDLDKIISDFQLLENTLDTFESKEDRDRINSVKLRLLDIIEIMPSALDPAHIAVLSQDEAAEVIVENLYEQLTMGKVYTTAEYLLAGIPKKYLSPKADLNSKENISLPLNLIVESIDPKEFSRRMTSLKKNLDVDHLPNVFTSGDAKQLDTSSLTTKTQETVQGATPSVTPSPQPTQPQEPAKATASSSDHDHLLLKVKDIVDILPAAFDFEASHDIPPTTKAVVFVKDLYDQLKSGKVSTSTKLLLSEVPRKYLKQDYDTNSETPIPLRLDLVVQTINPNELTSRTTQTAHEIDISNIPDIFSAPTAEEPEVTNETKETPKPEAVSIQEKPEQPIETPPVVEEKAEATITPSPVEEPTIEKPETSPIPDTAELQVQEPAATQESPPVGMEKETVVEASEPVEATEEPETVHEEAAETPERQREDTAKEETQESTSEPREPVHAASDHFSVTPFQKLGLEKDKGEPRPHLVIEETPPAAQIPVASGAFTIPPLMLRGIDINTASAKDLLNRIDGIGEQIASRIIKDRDLNGPFFDLFDLARVPGIGCKAVERMTGKQLSEEIYAQFPIVNQILGRWDNGLPDMSSIVERFKVLPGFEGCAILHKDGDLMASSWAKIKGAEALAGIGPQIVKKARQYLKQVTSAEPLSVSINMEGRTLTFVQSEDIVFVAIHSLKGLTRKHIQLVHSVGITLGRRLSGLRVVDESM